MKGSSRPEFPCGNTCSLHKERHSASETDKRPRFKAFFLKLAPKRAGPENQKAHSFAGLGFLNESGKGYRLFSFRITLCFLPYMK